MCAPQLTQADEQWSLEKLLSTYISGLNFKQGLSQNKIFWLARVSSCLRTIVVVEPAPKRRQSSIGVYVSVWLVCCLYEHSNAVECR